MKAFTPGVWDAHVCIPLRPDADFACLERHRSAGVRFTHVNVGMDDEPLHFVIRLLRSFAAQAEAISGFRLVNRFSDAEAARDAEELGIAFDLEGSNMLGEDVDALGLLRDLGVRQMHMIYNRANAAGGGCLDSIDDGLTVFGRDLVDMANDVGVVLDVSHAGHATSLQVIEASKYPVIFSHSNAARLVPHPRNIDDDQIRACAAKGGVVGVTGIAPFLGDLKGRTETIARHVEHIVNLVGPAHVGLGLDFVYGAEASPYTDALSVALFLDDPSRHAEPEQLPELLGFLAKRGYSESVIRAIAWGNFARVASNCWTDERDSSATAKFLPNRRLTTGGRNARIS